MNRSRGAAAALALSPLVVSIATVQGDVVWNEALNGDLSSAPATPTPIVLGFGTSSVIGTAGTGDTQDWVTVTVPQGFQIASLVHAVYASADPQGFMGVQAGSSFVGNPFAAGSYMGFAHFGFAAVNGAFPATNTVGSDMLALMANPAVAPGSTGFTTPLGPGTYTFLFQQLSGSTQYQFDFVLTPAPAGAAVLGLGLAGALRRSRR
ncbi:MAG TPA: hypothetical protein VEB22_08950 [Phycisphaerales bacterium]|nr:hypothetical protein [Phycisphaerales bacterium]